jgi:hypothetical protein
MIIASMQEFQLLIDTLLCPKLFKILEDKFSTQYATGVMKVSQNGEAP